MRKYLWIVAIALIASALYFTSCERVPQEMMETIMPDAEQIEPPPEMVEEMPPEMVEMPVDLVDVLIYTNRSFWITLEDAEMAAETTKRRLDAAGVQAEITKDDAYVREWMLHTTGDGNTNAIVLYGVLPASVYGTGNTQPDGSIAENWIETTDGDTILNHADYIAFNTDFDVDKVTEWTPDNADIAVGSNREDGLRNLMDNPNINLFTAFRADGGASMTVTSDGMTLTPSLSNFDSLRPIPLAQLQGEWFAEKVFASDTGDAEATYADPVILRDGDLGRLAIVHATTEHVGLLNGEVAAEIIINALLAPPMMETTPEPPTETVVETPAETPPEMEETSMPGIGTPTVSKIYWTQTNGIIRRANPDGSNVEDVVTGLGYASGIAIDSLEGKVYWVDHAGNGIQRANLDGTGIETLVSAADTQSPALLALDLSAGKMYWAGYLMTSVRRANLDGSNVEDYITGLSTPAGILLNVPGNKIYWTSGSIGNNTFYRANLDDLSNTEKLADLSGVYHLTLHPTLQKIFWTSSSSIRCANLDGSNVQDLVTGIPGGTSNLGGIELDIHGGKMYWRNWSTDKIQRANLDGSNVEEVVTDVHDPDFISFLYSF